MDDNAKLYFQLGEISQTLRDLKDDLERQQEVNRDMSKRIAVIEEFLQQTRGSWKTLLAIAGASSAVTGFLIKGWTILTTWHG